MPSFEDRLTALEAVVERLERGELSLDDSVRLFEEGVQLSNSCKLELEKAEGRIQVLVETKGGSATRRTGKAMRFDMINGEISGRALFDASLPVIEEFREAASFVF